MPTSKKTACWSTRSCRRAIHRSDAPPARCGPSRARIRAVDGGRGPVRQSAAFTRDRHHTHERERRGTPVRAAATARGHCARQQGSARGRGGSGTARPGAPAGGAARQARPGGCHRLSGPCATVACAGPRRPVCQRHARQRAAGQRAAGQRQAWTPGATWAMEHSRHSHHRQHTTRQATQATQATHHFIRPAPLSRFHYC